MFELERRVQCGAQLLDDHYPDWASKIDLSELDLHSPCSCILGQLYGYTEALQRLDLGEDKDKEYGFDLPPHCIDEWIELEQLWMKEIHARRKQ